jgi:hypothetical protein
MSRWRALAHGGRDAHGAQRPADYGSERIRENHGDAQFVPVAIVAAEKRRAKMSFRAAVDINCSAMCEASKFAD